MRRTILAACVALAFAGLSVAAQTPQPTRPSQPRTSAATTPAPDITTMTLTGCLKPWSGPMVGAATPTIPDGGRPVMSDPQYVLTDLDDSARKPGGTAETPVPKTPAAHDMYLLKAKDSTINLSQHVNHRVQVTGTVSSDSSSRGPSTSSASPSVPTPESGAPTLRDTVSAAGRPATLTVSSITMISATCPTTF